MQTTDTDVIVGSAITDTIAEPNFVESWADVAVIVAVPADAGVKTPALLILPMFDGLTDQATPLANIPVPATADVQLLVSFVLIDAGEQVTETEVIDGGRVTVIAAVLLP